MEITDLKNQILSEVESAFKKTFGKKPRKIELGFPPDIKLGDFSVNFFLEIQNARTGPTNIAKNVAEEISKSHSILILEAKAIGPYLNIKIDNKILFETAVKEINKEKNKFGNSKEDKGKKVMVEYLSPNTNKPLHLGHVRNGALGMAIANILTSQGNIVSKAILINDRGIHICKSMLAWLKWGNGQSPEEAKIKGDHFVGDWYVKYALEAKRNPKLEEEAQEMLLEWEAGAKEVRDVWAMMNKWVYAGYEETFSALGLKFDEYFYESEMYKLGKDIVEEGLKKNVFRKDENGAVLFDLSEDEFGLDKDGKKKKITVLRSDGTSVYLTQDLGTAVAREKKFKLNHLIYITGSEQIFHFQVLFKILKSLGYRWADNLSHFVYGMVTLPGGKMKSREGTVVDADDLIGEVENLVKEEIGKKDEKITEKEKMKRARAIAVGAIKFQMLRVRSSQEIKFDPRESIAIDGFTGPYCQYAYARISGILRKATLPPAPLLGKERRVMKQDFSLLGNDDERALIGKLINFPEEIKLAASELNPLRVVNAVYETAKAFNLFYNNHQVLGENNKSLASARLELVKATGEVLKKGLDLLRIEVLERM